ncbi:MAG: cysteine desulfurase family protein [Bacillota bacterium]
MKEIYFDHNATTKLNENVNKEMMSLANSMYANPSSVYKIARDSKDIIDQSKMFISKVLNCSNKEVYFTSGGSESNNWALKGIAYANKDKGKHIITSKIEHPSVLETCKYLKDQGFEITYLDVDKNGFIKIDQLKSKLRKDTILVSIMYANNVIGTIQPIKEISEILKDKNVYFHTDAVQYIKHNEIDLKNLNIDLLSLSGHKFYGPKGVGLLYIKKGIQIDPLIHGGGQERNLRAGTENYISQFGMYKALEIIEKNKIKRKDFVDNLTNYMLKKIKLLDLKIYINGSLDKRISGNIHLTIPDINQESLLFNLDLKGIFVSAGSACSSGSIERSKVLKAIGQKSIGADLRISLGYTNTKKEIDYFIKELKSIIERLK